MRNANPQERRDGEAGGIGVHAKPRLMLRQDATPGIEIIRRGLHGLPHPAIEIIRVSRNSLSPNEALHVLGSCREAPYPTSADGRSYPTVWDDILFIRFGQAEAISERCPVGQVVRMHQFNRLWTTTSSAFQYHTCFKLLCLQYRWCASQALTSIKAIPRSILMLGKPRARGSFPLHRYV
jgi:hypothetical protein